MLPRRRFFAGLLDFTVQQSAGIYSYAYLLAPLRRDRIDLELPHQFQPQKVSQEIDHHHIKKVLSGDRDAFRYFITNYQELATRIAFSMVRDETQARHIVQNAFIQAYKNLSNFKQEARFSTWLYRIVVNESIKISRKSKVEQRTVPISASHTIRLQTDNGALDTIELKEKRKQINQVLSLMKPKERLMLELYYLQENTIAEIQMITGFSISNIKVLLHRARKNFAAFFKSSN